MAPSATNRSLSAILRILALAARARRGLRPARRRATPRRLVHVSPGYFSDESLIGGAERYAMELAAALAERVDVTLITFGQVRRSIALGRLRIEVYEAVRWLDEVRYDPLSYGFLMSLVDADIVHCHQQRVAVTTLSILAATALGKPVFVTDHGGSGVRLRETLRSEKFIERFLPVSAFSASLAPKARCSAPLYGGVRDELLEMSVSPSGRENVLFVGRLLPHKGIDTLIRAVPRDMPLEIVGRVHHGEYFSMLKRLAGGKRVCFITDASDSQVADAYSRARVCVLPSVYRDVYGVSFEKPELLGLVLLEGMASGVPVICTDVGGMPEIVADGVTGYVVPPGDPKALRERLQQLTGNPQLADEMGLAGRALVRSKFKWDAVAQRCLDGYVS